MSWLASTAVHEAVRLARRDRREASLEARAATGCELNLHDTALGPHEQAEFRHRLELLRDLPKRQQRLLWMKGVGLSYEEIAAQAGLTCRAVERQIHRGRARLRAAA